MNTSLLLARAAGQEPDEVAVSVADVGDGLPPGHVRRRLHQLRASGLGAGDSGGHVVGDQGDFKAGVVGLRRAPGLFVVGLLFFALAFVVALLDVMPMIGATIAGTAARRSVS